MLDFGDLRDLADFISNGGHIISFNATNKTSQPNGVFFTDGKPEVELVQAVKASCAESFAINDADILVTPYFSTDVSGYVFHLVNYTFDFETHDVSEKENISMKITDDFPYGTEDIGVYYKTPENCTLTELEFAVSEGKLTFSIPVMSAWASVVIGQKERIEALEQLDRAKTSYDTRGIAQVNSTINTLLEEANSLFCQGKYDEMYQKCEDLIQK